MKVLYTGATGQLGKALAAILPHFGYDSHGTTRQEMDLSDPISIENFFRGKRYDAIIASGAYTAVDKAEEEKDLCMQVNTKSAIQLCKIAESMGAKFVLISSDYVFDGTKDGLYETYDKVNPLNVYGLSKVLAEKEVIKYSKSFIVRTSWVFGDGHNFVNTMLTLSKTHKELKVICDQIGSPTYAPDLAKFLADLIGTDKYGLYHCTNEGFCSWYEFAKELFHLAKSDTIVRPILTKDYPTLARRPLNSKLSKGSIRGNGFKLLPAWESALGRKLENDLRS